MKSEPLKIEDSQEIDFSTNDSQSFFGRISSRILKQKEDSKTAGTFLLKTTEALLLLQNYEETRQGWFWSTDETGNITYVTDSLAEAMNQSQQGLIGT
ncbi:MAG: hypothetical protein V7676_18695, partial [Parasphingorhabdus sp.]|uniref:hypothetical protein n=1 Tax=Parasphingorhabdus sp. TaxID=2709688 RepID=UPI0030029F88